MKNQRTALRIGAAAMLSLFVAGAALAAPGRLPQPRITQHGFHAMDPRPGLMPLGIGKPTSLAMVESWVTSDLVSDDYTTFPFWYDSEYISIFLAFFTAKSTDVKISIQIKDQTGTTVFSGQDVEAFDPETLVGGTIPVGTLVPGAYKVLVKLKQGATTVGQQYWLLVYADPGS
jgi:hypothetical protein